MFRLKLADALGDCLGKTFLSGSLHQELCVLAWELSNTLDASFCVAALAMGRQPTIFNTDQGSQFTSEAFAGVLTGAGIAISMDGVGRAFDNIMVERLWRTVKYEDVYLRDYQTPASVYGLEVLGSSEQILVQPTKRDRIETGGGRSVAAIAAVAAATLRFASATAAGTSPMQAVPPYSRPETVQRMGTS